MLSFKQQQSIEKQITAIDLALSETEPYQYQLREQLREDKKNPLEQLKKDRGK